MKVSRDKFDEVVYTFFIDNVAPVVSRLRDGAVKAFGVGASLPSILRNVHEMMVQGGIETEDGEIDIALVEEGLASGFRVQEKVSPDFFNNKDIGFNQEDGDKFVEMLKSVASSTGEGKK